MGGLAVKIVVFDDEAVFRGWMESVIRGCIAGKKIELALSTGDRERLESFIDRNEAQTVFFIDLMIAGKLVGLALAQKVKEKNRMNMVSFITHYPDKVMFETEAKLMSDNVILKGNVKRMAYEIEKTIDYFCFAACPDTLTVSDRSGVIYRFAYQDILYIEAEKSCH